MLAGLFGAEAGLGPPGAGRALALTGFQEAGVRRARAILRRWGGVVIADAVGLGKTFMGLALVEEELRAGGSVVLAVPASLRGTWRRLARRLEPGAGGALHVLSHAQLSRGSYPASLAGSSALVVVDEAHRFRNPGTRRHAALAELCRGARTVLLTATPINNGPADLYALLRLFLEDGAFVASGVPSLRELLVGGRPPPEAVRRVLRQVTVRRGRSHLRRQDVAGPHPPALARFPRRSAPRVVRYDDPRLPRLVAAIEALELRCYAVPGDAGGTGGGVPALVRLGLLKRLESGAPALRASVARQLGFLRSFDAALASGSLLRPGALPWSRAGDDGDPLQLVLLEVVAIPCPPAVDRAALAGSVRRDLARLRSVLALLAGPDPKLASLRRLVAGVAPEKVVVFTEFRDTAEAVWRGVASEVPTGRIDGAGAWLGLRRAGRDAVVRRFAPLATGAREPPPRERVRLLVATDVLAEGMNLQDARHVVSYDLPWNPVRLMQRIGRIDRLGSPHDEVVPHLFLPAAGLEELLGLTRRVAAKLGGIAAALGDEESLQLLERLGHGEAAAAGVLESLETGADDPLEGLRLRWQTGRGAGPGAADAPAATMACLEPIPGEPLRAVALARTGGQSWLLEAGTDGTIREAGEAATRAVTRALEATGGRVVAAPGALREAARIAGLVRDHLELITAAGAAPPPLRNGEPGPRLARRVRTAMSGPIACASTELVARADRVLQTLSRPLPAQLRARASRLAADLSDEPDRVRVVEAIESLLAGSGTPAPGAGRRAGAPDPAPGSDITALLLLRPGEGHPGAPDQAAPNEAAPA
jgi:hypothetical protein